MAHHAATSYVPRHLGAERHVQPLDEKGYSALEHQVTPFILESPRLAIIPVAKRLLGEIHPYGMGTQKENKRHDI